MKLSLIIYLILNYSLLFSENYKKIKTDITNFEKLKSFDFFIPDEVQFNKSDKSISFFISESNFKYIEKNGVKVEILIDNWNIYYENLPELTESEKSGYIEESRNLFNVTGFGFGSMGGFYTFAEITDKLDEMYNDFPELITEKYSIGTSEEGRTIWAVKISDNPNQSENEPQVFCDALIHAREPASMSSLMYYMYYLLENYGTDPEVTYLVNNREMFFVLCFNPDGYEYNRQTNPNGGGMWRKNRSINSGYYGVDLNRNFGYMWGYDNSGSSPDPSSETYRGPSAFSEPETQVIRNFVIDKNIKTYINFHTYSDVIIYPWGYSGEETPDSLTYREYASDMSQWNGYSYGTSEQTIGYASNGTARDWMYGEQNDKNKIISYVFEIGGSSDGFWPSQSRIFPLAQENLRPNLYNAWTAGEFIDLLEIGSDSEFFMPGDTVYASVKLKNKGQSDALNVNIVAESISDDLVILSGNFAVPNIPARTEISTNNNLVFLLNGNTTPGEKQFIEFSIYTGADLMLKDTLSIIPGMPVFVFEDNENDPTILWDIYSSPATPKWDKTESTYFSAPNSYTDSKTGNYAASCDVRLTSKQNIDLTNVLSPVLSFYTKFDIEAEWDGGQVLISTNNGNTWQPLKGEYMTPGSGQGIQTLSEFYYDGSQSSWVKEEIDLSAFAGSQIKIRFQLKADGYIQRDGWFLDDIKIYYYGGDIGNYRCTDISFIEGWNMLSIPLNSSNSSLTSVFPTANSLAFYFEDYYKITEILENDLGYWIKFPSAGNTEICGYKLDGEIEVKEGWNLIGSFSDSVAVENIYSEPNGIIQSAFFKFGSGYSSADYIIPGKGYWIKTSADGKIMFDENIRMPKIKVNSSDIIKITDSKNNTMDLFLTEEENIYSELPPLPPKGVFDARFVSNKLTAVKSNKTFKILLKDALYPIKVELPFSNLTVLNGEKVGEQNIFLIKDKTLTEINITKSEIPEKFSVAQNYPNPFNPTTKIEFSLPENSAVKIQIYNVLGELIQEINRELLNAGTESIEINLADYSSGVYFYKIIATSTSGVEFQSLKKMILMK